jgi:hypothetical protein
MSGSLPVTTCTCMRTEGRECAETCLCTCVIRMHVHKHAQAFAPRHTAGAVRGVYIS